MTEAQKQMMDKLGLMEEDFLPQLSPQEIAEEAYLIAQYNAVLIEIMMEE